MTESFSALSLSCRLPTTKVRMLFHWAKFGEINSDNLFVSHQVHWAHCIPILSLFHHPVHDITCFRDLSFCDFVMTLPAKQTQLHSQSGCFRWIIFFWFSKHIQNTRYALWRLEMGERKMKLWLHAEFLLGPLMQYSDGVISKLFIVRFNTKSCDIDVILSLFQKHSFYHLSEVISENLSSVSCKQAIKVEWISANRNWNVAIQTVCNNRGYFLSNEKSVKT